MPSPWTQDAYIEACMFAARAHRNQQIPGTDLAYLAHLTRVTMEVMAALAVEEGFNGDLAIQCALLHDIVEDTSVTRERVAENFGPAVAHGVAALTKNPAVGSKADQMRDSLERIQAQPHEVWLVKLGDRISNLNPPPYYWTRRRTTAYYEEAQLIHRTLGAASPLLADRLQERIDAYRPHTTLP
ncbi:MAG: HD domain-containing protein [Myxococcota bacterium]